MRHAFLVYPAVAALAVAAALPLAAPALLFGGSAEAAPIANRSAPPRVVVVSSAGGMTAPAEAPSTAVGPAPVAGDDRWWRSQLAQMTTTSVVSWPGSPAPPRPEPRWDTGGAAYIGAPRSSAAVAMAPPRRMLETRLGPAVPAAIRRWEALILRYASKHAVDPNLVAALMQTESGGNPNAVSSMNAVGLMQVLNGPFDPEQNLDRGIGMLAGHLRQYGRIDLALAAYNAGPGAVANYGGIPPYEETHNHIARTLASYAAFRA